MPEAKRKSRCAIYTRKSTEDGLEQDFNSLDAQREACAAYILSQTHEDGREHQSFMMMAALVVVPWRDPGSSNFCRM